MVYAARTAGLAMLLLFLALLLLSPNNADAVMGWAMYGICYGVTWVFSSFQHAIGTFVVLMLLIYFFGGKGGGGGHHG